MAVTELLLASQNPGKLEEMRALVQGLPFLVRGPRDLGIVDAPAETGTTFLENAALKANYYGVLSGRLAVADDSGLSVEVMNGGPGLFSSRFGGEGANDADRNRLLLARLQGVPPGKRGARFTSAVALARGPAIIFDVEESVEGEIVEVPRGANGFGYDPLFYYPELKKTFGEMSPEEKARVSHRGKAFAQLRVFLVGLASREP